MKKISALLFMLMCISRPVLAADVFVEEELGAPEKLLSRALQHPDVDGVTLNIEWAAVEPVKGEYLWGEIDQAIDLAAKANKKIGLHFYQTYRDPAPQWLKVDGANGYIGPSPRKNGGSVNDIVPWDPVLNKNWKLFLTALSKHLTEKKTIDYVAYVMEGLARGNLVVKGCVSGFVDTTRFDSLSHIQSSVARAIAMRDAFPKAKLVMIVPPVDVCGGDNFGAASLDEILKGMGKDAKNIIVHASDFNIHGSRRLSNSEKAITFNPIGMKPIWSPITDRKNYLEGPFKDVVCQGVATYHPVYFEAYLQDLSISDQSVTDAIHAMHTGDTDKLCRKEQKLGGRGAVVK